MPKGPLVHTITNAVTAPFVADCLAAVGARPIMAEAPDDTAALAGVAQGLCINLGQLDAAKQAAIHASLRHRGDRPWVLDPVGVAALPSRLSFAKQLLKFKPSIIRGNASEIWALASGEMGGSGTDQGAIGPTNWQAVAQKLNAPTLAITQAKIGENTHADLAVGAQVETFQPGHPSMGQLPGFGCALSAVCAALGSASKALALFSEAGQRLSHVPLGDVRSQFISALSQATRRRRTKEMLPLYFVAGPQDCNDLVECLKQALAGGITAFQYRPKHQDAGTVLQHGLTLRALCAEAGVPFIANDDLALAVALAADGLHLGQGDGCPARARAQLGAQALIGLSVSAPDHWAAYAGADVDYVGIGPFAATATKPDTRAALGVAGTGALRREGVLSVAIGGLNATNVAAAMGAQVDGVAVVSAIAKASAPFAASRNLVALVRTHSKPI